MSEESKTTFTENYLGKQSTCKTMLWYRKQIQVRKDDIGWGDCMK
jgi:hypothetical protein